MIPERYENEATRSTVLRRSFPRTLERFQVLDQISSSSVMAAGALWQPEGSGGNFPAAVTSIYKVATCQMTGFSLQIVRRPLTRGALAAEATRGFGDMIKAVVDVERGILAIGAELHADEESALLDDGSRQGDLWAPSLPGIQELRARR